MEDDDSDNEGADDPELEREVIAEKLFVGGSDEVSCKTINKWVVNYPKVNKCKYSVGT